MSLPDTPTALVTGATGFLGSHLVERLLQRGYEVRCLVYEAPDWTTESQNWLDALPVTCIPGGVGDEAVLRRAVDAVDIVYHLAGRTQAPSRRVFYETNVQGTLNVLAAVCDAAPTVHRVFITSSLAAVGDVEERPATETTPLRPVSAYGESKAEMERALRQQPSETASYWDRLPITVVRPSSVYGPREPDSLIYHQIVRHGFCPVVQNNTPSRLSFVFVHDLIDGFIAAAESEAAVGETYCLGSRETYSWTELGTVIADALGHDSPRMLRLSPGVLWGLAAVVEGWGWVTGTPTEFDREKAREICRACKMCRHEKAQADFGYQPNTPLAEGMQETVAWYRRVGWL